MSHRRDCFLHSEIIEQLLGAVLVLGGNGFYVQYANPAAESFFGLSRNKLKNMALEELVGKDHPVLMLLEQVLIHKSNVVAHELDFMSLRFLHKNVIAEGVYLETAAESVVLVLHGFFSEKRINTQDGMKNDLKNMSAIASSLMHEIKNPLAGIRGAAQLLEDSMASEEDRMLAQLVRKEVDRIRNIVDRVDQFQIYTLDRHEVNIHEVLEHVRLLVEHDDTLKGRIVFQEFYDPSLPCVLGNHEQLIQVFLNLFKNSVDAILSQKDSGVITIKTSYRSGYKRINPVHGETGDSYLPIVITIHDTGHGIDESIKLQIFDSFFTTKADGKGLGLPLCGKIISEHGGSIEVGSPTQGAEMVIRLPYHKKD